MGARPSTHERPAEDVDRSPLHDAEPGARPVRIVLLEALPSFVCVGDDPRVRLHGCLDPRVGPVVVGTHRPTGQIGMQVPSGLGSKKHAQCNQGCSPRPPFRHDRLPKDLARASAPTLGTALLTSHERSLLESGAAILHADLKTSSSSSGPLSNRHACLRRARESPPTAGSVRVHGSLPSVLSGHCPIRGQRSPRLGRRAMLPPDEGVTSRSGPTADGAGCFGHRRRRSPPGEPCAVGDQVPGEQLDPVLQGADERDRIETGRDQATQQALRPDGVTRQGHGRQSAHERDGLRQPPGDPHAGPAADGARNPHAFECSRSPAVRARPP